MEKEKYWKVMHSADTTETGCFMHRSYFKTIWKGFPAQQYHEKEIVEDYCRSRFGDKVAYVQGVAPCKNWDVRESDQEEFNNPKPIVWGGWKTETLIIIMEIGDHGKTKVISEEKTTRE